MTYRACLTRVVNPLQPEPHSREEPYRRREEAECRLPLTVSPVEGEAESLVLALGGRAPGKRARDERRDVPLPFGVGLGIATADVGALFRHRRNVDGGEERDHEEEQRPVPGDREAGGEQ